MPKENRYVCTTCGREDCDGALWLALTINGKETPNAKPLCSAFLTRNGVSKEDAESKRLGDTITFNMGDNWICLRKVED